jgi:HD domain
MRRSLPEVLPGATAIALSTVIAIVLFGNANLDQQLSLITPGGHFYIVSAASFVFVLPGLAAVIGALRGSSIRVLMLALGFISLGAIFTIHGLATPGFILDSRYFGVTGFSSRLTIVVASSWLALSVARWPDSLETRLIHHRYLIAGSWAVVLLGYTALALTRPASLPPAITTAPIFLIGTNVAVIAFASITGLQYLHGYLLTRHPLFLAVSGASVLMIQAQIGIHFGSVWEGAFWLYHLQLLAAAAAIAWGLISEYARGDALTGAFDRLGERNLIAQIRSGYSEQVLSLAAALEARDGYTIGHGQRVGALAVLIGRELGLSEIRLRALAQGALLHDVGKIGVPDAILHKPGPLDDDEFAIIQEHPVRGDEILGSSSGSTVERAVVRHHHEKFDGSGYPDHLVGETIPLEARIAAVADVYDALRSARSYREAWTRDRAIAQIEADSGAHFDPACIPAFLKAVDEWERTFAADGAIYHERRATAA